MDQVKKNKSLLFIIGFLLLTNVAMLIFFLKKDAADRSTPQTGRFTTALQKDVGFSESQMKEYQDMKAKHIEQFRPMLDDLKNAKLKFYDLVYALPVSDSLLNASSDQIAGRQKALDIQMFRYFERIRHICRKEQLPQFDSAVKHLVIRMISRSERRPRK